MKFVAAAALAVSSALAFFASPVHADCCRPEDHRTITKLDLYESTVVTNELHLEHGELRYNNVGVFEDNTLDLVVTITSGDYTDITDEWDRQDKEWPNTNGKNNKFGVINLQTSPAKPYSGRGNFRFCLVQAGTDVPVTLETFSFTVYDTDERGDDDTKAGIGIKERLFLDTSQLASYQLVDGSEIVTGCEDGSIPSPNCPDGVRTVFHSSTAGTGKDNPSDPNILTDKQKKRSIGFNFDDTSCWEFTYDHYCPVDQPDYDGSETECRWYGGGNFLFAGTSDIIVNEGQCNPTPTPPPTASPTEPPTASPSGSPSKGPTYPPTAVPSGSPSKRPTYPPTSTPSGSPSDRPTYPPTKSPTDSPSGTPSDRPTHPPTTSPSGSPTQSPVDFSAAPTASPTDGENPGPPTPVCPIPDPDPVPDTCPEDVTVIKQVGVTPIEGVDAVQIISQDTNTVTVSLKNAWTEEVGVHVDQIYYQYKTDYLDEDCYPALQVPGSCHYAEITIQCYAHKPFAELDICVADTGGALQTGGDTATIPKCCHAEVEDETPTVCYKLVINCETVCVDSVDRERRALRGAAN